MIFDIFIEVSSRERLLDIRHLDSIDVKHLPMQDLLESRCWWWWWNEDG